MPVLAHMLLDRIRQCGYNQSRTEKRPRSQLVGRGVQRPRDLEDGTGYLTLSETVLEIGLVPPLTFTCLQFRIGAVGVND